MFYVCDAEHDHDHENYQTDGVNKCGKAEGLVFFFGIFFF